MTPELCFTICNNAVLPAWLLLVFAPHWRWTQNLVHSALIPAVLGLVYLAAFATSSGTPEGASMSSLEGVMKLFTSPNAVLAGWVHYLAFDLFVGAWEVRDARRHGIHHGFVIPCLVLTLGLGPVGLLLYLGLRAGLRREFLLDESRGSAARSDLAESLA
jgi:hypothetical protein